MHIFGWKVKLFLKNKYTMKSLFSISVTLYPVPPLRLIISLLSIYQCFFIHIQANANKYSLPPFLTWGLAVYLRLYTCIYIYNTLMHFTFSLNNIYVKIFPYQY